MFLHVHYTRNNTSGFFRFVGHIDGYMSSPERGTRGTYEEPYYSQYGTRGGSVTPVIDEEQRCVYIWFVSLFSSVIFNQLVSIYSDAVLAEDQYALYGGHKVTGRIPRSGSQMYDASR